jgi:hypothetical protein
MKISNSRKKLYRILKNFRFLPVPILLKLRYGAYTGKKLNLENPVEFNEKKNWLKLNYHPPILTQLADKFAVRSYVTEKIGPAYLNELYGIYRCVEEIDFEALPDQFIMKATHGCRKTLIVRDKTGLDLKRTKKILREWLKYNHYKSVGFEWAYKNIKPGIVVEKLLVEAGKKFLTDYKFVCMNGKCVYTQVIMDWNGMEVQGNFNKEFELQEFNTRNRESFSGLMEKPALFSKMWDLAEVLADRFPLARADFYLVDQQIIFGEMTFYPGDGKYDFYPDRYNKIIGDMLQLPNLGRDRKEIVEY